MEESKRPSHGDIISIGIAKLCEKVQIEYFDVMDESSSSYILLDKKDCQTIQELYKLLKERNS